MKRICVFASGNGTNFEAIINAIEAKKIDAICPILICDKKDAYVLERAKKHNVKSYFVSLKKEGSKELYEKKILSILNQYQIDLICLAGYMKIIGDIILKSYEGRIINIHPALLPSFKGAHGILDAFNYGVKVFGVTVHFVSSELDGGKIICQRAFEYYGNDISYVEEKIHEIEHVLYIEAINRVIEGESYEKSVN